MRRALNCLPKYVIEFFSVVQTCGTTMDKIVIVTL